MTEESGSGRDEKAKTYTCRHTTSPNKQPRREVSSSSTQEAAHPHGPHESDNDDLSCEFGTDKPGGERQYEEMRARYMEQLDKPMKKSKEKVLDPAVDDFINAGARGMGCRRPPLNVYFENKKAGQYLPFVDHDNRQPHYRLTFSSHSVRPSGMQPFTTTGLFTLFASSFTSLL